MDFPWTIETLSSSDIWGIVQDQWPEGPTLEFKSAAYANTNSGQKEMLRDIASMANADGGYLFMGLSEDDHGRAKSVIGVSNPDSQCQRINQTCIDSIVERIPCLEIRAIEAEAATHVIVVWVPQSNSEPHMICREGKRSFGRDTGETRG